MSNGKRTRVLVVDDSALMRQILTSLFAQDPELELVGTASDPFVAWAKIQELKPDVLTLDVEMPRMDGLTFLEKLMRARPMPVLMVSSLTEQGCATTLRALELGAVDFVSKPKLDLRAGTVELGAELIAKVKAAAQARPRARRPASVTPAARGRVDTPAPAAGAATGAPAAPATQRAQRPGALLRSTHGVVAIGASTGGTEALRELLCALPPDSPGIVIVQHMPEHFTAAFARRLDGLCRVRVREARDGDTVLPGHVLIAPGNFHLHLVRSGATYLARVSAGAAVNHHRPSVNVLFNSCAEVVGSNALGLLLTGMGDDGAQGLLAMRRAGAQTAAQDEATSVVFGMPKVAIALGAAAAIHPLEEMAKVIGRWARERA
jgi:two-component system, chemotaxis family, protein-glutamate methylesterase/glutaminase